MSSETGTNFLRPSGQGALIIDGKLAAVDVVAAIKTGAAALAAEGVTPGLAVVLVGNDPASAVYVRSKSRLAAACGFHSVQHDLAAETTTDTLLALVATLNADAKIHGILIQLPLPAHVDSARVLEAVDPRKDVDGFHPVNAGLLASGDAKRALLPCTPSGCMQMIRGACDALGRTIEGADALVIGRSNIVGKPMAQLLLAAGATVTIAHSKTRDLPGHCAQADILVAAVGRPEMVRGSWIKPGAIIIDVGINRVAKGDGGYVLQGDVAYAETLALAAAVTPVPGGVGQLTVPYLIANTLEAARRQTKR